MTAALGVILRAPWTPKRLPNLVNWYRSDAGITIATGVSAWADQSGNGRTLLQADTTQQPSYAATTGPNGLPGLTFDGVNDMFDSTLFTLAQPYTRYSLIKQVSFTNGDTIFDGATVNISRLYQHTVSPNLGVQVSTSSGQVGGATIGSWVAVCELVTGANSILRINDTETALVGVGTNAAGGICVAGDAPSGAFGAMANVVVAELFEYSGAHDLATRNLVMGYLKREAGL